MKKLALPLLLAILIAGAVIQPASARMTGIFDRSGVDAGSTCSACHSGGSAPTVSMAGPTTLITGATGTYTLTITSGSASQTAAGLNVAVADIGSNIRGTMATVNGETQVNDDNNQITHTWPKSADGSGVTTFTFQYTAHSVAGDYTMYYAGNSVNGSFDTNGDQPAFGQFTITVSEPVTTAVTLNSATTTQQSQALPLLLIALALLILLILTRQFTKTYYQ